MPTRLAARHVSELLLGRRLLWKPLVPHERLAGMVFGLVVGESIAQQPFVDRVADRWIGLETAGASPRLIGSTAIARSMRLPETSVRRKLAELVDGGLLTRGASGYGVSERFCADPRLPLVCDDDARRLGAALSAMAALGVRSAEAGSAALAALPPTVVERLILAFELRVLETTTELYGDLTSGVIVTTAIAANVRHITQDPALARRYAHEDCVPPDELRRPIGLRALAKATELPFETVRRRAAALAAQGVFEVHEAGVVVPSRVLAEARQIGNNRRIARHFEHLIAALPLLASRGPRGDLGVPERDSA